MSTVEKVQEQIEIIEQEFKSETTIDEVIVEEIKEEIKEDVKKSLSSEEIKEDVKKLTKQEKDQKRKQKKAQEEQEERNAKLLEENKKAVVDELSKLTELTTLLNNTLQKIETTAYKIARNDLCVGYMHEFLNKELKILNGVGESWVIWLNIEQNLLMVPQFPVEWFLNKTEKEDRVQMQLDTAVSIQKVEKELALKTINEKTKRSKWGPKEEGDYQMVCITADDHRRKKHIYKKMRQDQDAYDKEQYDSLVKQQFQQRDSDPKKQKK